MPPRPRTPATYTSVPAQMSPPLRYAHQQQQQQMPQPQRYGSDNDHSQYAQSYMTSPPPSTDEHAMLVNTRSTTQGVATGAIGGGYGPYSYGPTTPGGYNPARFSNMSNASGFSDKDPATTAPVTPATTAPLRTNTIAKGFVWDAQDPDNDDSLHNPDPVRDAILDSKWTIISWRGLMNLGFIVVLYCSLIGLFAGWPVATWFTETHPTASGYNLGGINGSGQIPDLNVPTLIDADTPQSAYTRTGFDGHGYSLVFSDEFNTNGRSFYEGDDPFWEAVNMHYWATGDLEWYREDSVTTNDGSMVITLTEEPINGLNFKSGMVQSWNKFCFTTGYIEVNMSLPGDPKVPGFWPAAWTMGNLGRIGYGATTDGTWPFSYDSCDVGTFPNQTTKQGTPAAAAGGLSYQPGQRVSACTCPGSDHPGPSVSTGRGAPEIDIIEAETNLTTLTGSASQSAQVAPYDPNWQFNQADAVIYNSSLTGFNSYVGGPYQQAISSHTNLGLLPYNNTGYETYGFEYWSDPNDRNAGFITWAKGGEPTWTAYAAAVGPNPLTEVGQRLISEEPMSIALNLGLAPSFQKQDWKHLVFPARLYIDYIRVYQRNGVNNIGCDPASYPTKNYIESHINAYTNPNLTVWSQAGYTFPRNSQYDGC